VSKKEPPPTLADAVLREGLHPRAKWVAPGVTGRLAAARRFVLDDGASSFLSDLAHANFVQGRAQALRAIESSRHLARLPHALMWVEYDARAERRRTLEAYEAQAVTSVSVWNGTPGRLAPPDELVPHVGWLLEQHPQVVTAFRMTQFHGLGDGLVVQDPFDFAWVADDEAVMPWEVLPMRGVGPEALAELATGIVGYRSTRVAMLPNLMAPRLTERQQRAMFYEGAAELRRALTLLSAINDVPVGVRQVEQSRGFVARGRYRRFLSHSVISILLPKGRDPRRVARDAIAAARRRAHQVRGHWRRDWRHEGLRIWVHEHQRGDASLGFVTHDYKVEHVTT
jgi:hypothetical protein